MLIGWCLRHFLVACHVTCIWERWGMSKKTSQYGTSFSLINRTALRHLCISKLQKLGNGAKGHNTIIIISFWCKKHENAIKNVTEAKEWRDLTLNNAWCLYRLMSKNRAVCDLEMPAFHIPNLNMAYFQGWAWNYGNIWISCFLWCGSQFRFLSFYKNL